MIKRKRVYICDNCSAVALEQWHFFYDDCWKGPPDGWTKLGREDLCPLCTAVYRKFKDEAMEEKQNERS